MKCVRLCSDNIHVYFVSLPECAQRCHMATIHFYILARIYSFVV